MDKEGRREGLEKGEWWVSEFQLCKLKAPGSCQVWSGEVRSSFRVFRWVPSEGLESRVEGQGVGGGGAVRPTMVLKRHPSPSLAPRGWGPRRRHRGPLRHRPLGGTIAPSSLWSATLDAGGDRCESPWRGEGQREGGLPKWSPQVSVPRPLHITSSLPPSHKPFGLNSRAPGSPGLTET